LLQITACNVDHKSSIINVGSLTDTPKAKTKQALTTSRLPPSK